MNINQLLIEIEKQVKKNIKSGDFNIKDVKEDIKGIDDELKKYNDNEDSILYLKLLKEKRIN